MVSTGPGLQDTMDGSGNLLTQRMTTAQLRLLGVFCSKFVSKAVKQLNITLLRVLLHRVNESP